MGMDELAADGLQEVVDRGGLAGAVTALWRDGRVVQRAAVGWRDREAGEAMRPDAIFRIASMSKPVASVAALQLLEEGAFELDDPVMRWAPELGSMRVARTLADPLDTVPAHRPITMGDLLTHRSGLTYGAFHPGPLEAIYREALGAEIDSVRDPDAWIAGLAGVPLVDQPGSTLHYGHSTDLLGFLLARMEDAPLPDVLRARVFDRLGMSDTGFVVPAERHPRRAVQYGFDAGGALTPLQVAPGQATLAERPTDLPYASAGQGLWSTVDDYLTFARIFLGDASVDGVRLLRPQTLARLRTNVLTPAQRLSAEVGGMPLFAEGHGFGLGLAVVLEPDLAAPTICRGAPGTVGWPGAYGGWWQADPVAGTAMVFLTHSMIERDQLADGIGMEVYGAIELVHELFTEG